jgi:hypothetical protein
MTGFIELFNTARDYTLQVTVTHTHNSVHICVLTSRCLVAASKDGRSPSALPKYPRASATSF